jgi:hypothetical protein
MDNNDHSSNPNLTSGERRFFAEVKLRSAFAIYHMAVDDLAAAERCLVTAERRLATAHRTLQAVLSRVFREEV